MDSYKFLVHPEDSIEAHEALRIRIWLEGEENADVKLSAIARARLIVKGILAVRASNLTSIGHKQPHQVDVDLFPRQLACFIVLDFKVLCPLVAYLEEKLALAAVKHSVFQPTLLPLLANDVGFLFQDLEHVLVLTAKDQQVD